MENRLMLMVNSTVKRFIDIVGALIGLLVLAVVFVPIAIAIKLESPGPIFFTQTRYGRQGKPFQMRKFRSMVANAAEFKPEVLIEAQKTHQKDPRITRVGSFLRRMTLDELPQFWNVLVGEMSLVGTHPLTTDELNYYGEQQLQKVTVKPGITGEYMVITYSAAKDWEQIVALDQRYQSQWHPLSDLVIFWKTLGMVMHRVFVGESWDKQSNTATNAAKKNRM